MSNMINIGALDGTLDPVTTTWGDVAVELLIASGGHLQHFDNVSLTTIADSPICDLVIRRDSRAVVTGNNGSTLTFSGVGDPYNWTAGNDDDMQYVEVGYKSGGYINGMASLSKDLIIFKTDGSVFRLIGSFPDWEVPQCGNRVWNLNRFSCVEVENDVWFIDRFYGLSRMSTVVQYGEIAKTSFAEEVNAQIVRELDTYGRLWNVTGRGEVWVKTQLGAKHVYVYNLYKRAWTMFEFPLEPTGAMSVGAFSYVALRGEDSLEPDGLVYRMDPELTDDFGNDISASLELRPLHSGLHHYLLKHTAVDTRGSGTLDVLVNGTNLMGGPIFDEERFGTYQNRIGRSLSMRLEAVGKVKIDQITVDAVEI